MKHARLVFSFFNIRALHDLHHIRASLTTETSETITAAIVGSRLDFCNSLLAGTSVSNLTRLQLIQNTLARVVAQKPRFCHITLVLSDLHWLPVRHKISFKIATIIFRVPQFQQPTYLASLIPKYVLPQALCSSLSLSICVPSDKTTMANSIIVFVCCFKRMDCITKSSVVHSNFSCFYAFRRALKLKHHLFLLTYLDISAKSDKIKPA